MSDSNLMNVYPVERGSNKTPGNTSGDLTSKFEIRSIEDNILAEFKRLKAQGASYVFLIMFVIDKVGIAKATQTIKAIAKIENILQKIMGDLGDFSQLLKALLDHIDLSKYTGKDYNDAAINQITKWLDQGKNGPHGNMTNGQYLIYLFKDLFGANGKGGLLAQYQKALNNPWYKQKPDSVISGLKSLLGGSNDTFTGSNWTNNSTYGNHTFLDFLTGKAHYNSYQMADAMYQAFVASWFNKTGEKPKGKDGKKTFSDVVGDATNILDGIKTTANGINSQDSAKLSMTTQNLQSLDKTAQDIITNYSQFTQGATNNQKGQ